MDWILDPEIWASLLTLTALEIVLGIDNLVFIAILAGNLPIAKGNVVVNGNRIAVELTEMPPRAPDKR